MSDVPLVRWSGTNRGAVVGDHLDWDGGPLRDRAERHRRPVRALGRGQGTGREEGEWVERRNGGDLDGLQLDLTNSWDENISHFSPHYCYMGNKLTRDKCECNSLKLIKKILSFRRRRPMLPPPQ